MSTLRALAKEWLTERTASGGRSISRNTVLAYRRDMAIWNDLLDAEVGRAATPEDFTHVEAATALARMLNDRKDSAATRRRAFATMSNFCTWMINNDHLQKNPLRGLAPPARAKRTPVAFEDDDVARLFAAASKDDDNARSPAPELDLAILVLLGAGGLRVSEAANLAVRDYRPGDEPLLRVIGKGDKQRVVPLDPATGDLLGRYADWRTTVVTNDRPTSPFLVKPTGKHLDRHGIDYRVRKLYSRAGVPAPEGAASHALRHTFAISSINGGAALHEVQELLGHESLATTGLYLRAAGQHLRAAAGTSATARLLKQR